MTQYINLLKHSKYYFFSIRQDFIIKTKKTHFPLFLTVSMGFPLSVTQNDPSDVFTMVDCDTTHFPNSNSFDVFSTKCDAK